MAEVPPIAAPRLARIVHPIGVEEFLANYWERQPLVVARKDPGYFADLLSFDDVDAVLTAADTHHPHVRMTKNEEPPKIADYTRSGGRVDPIAAAGLFTGGATFILDQMQRRLPSLGALCGALEKETGIAFQTNIYLTPPNAGGFKTHYDTHDVFILQIEGTKDWQLFESGVALPLNGQHHEDCGIPAGAVTHRFTLGPGDTAYIPRGVYHCAHAGTSLSLHITLGALVRTWSEFLIKALAELSLRDPSFRQALPVGFGMPGYDARAAEQAFWERLNRMREGMDFTAAAQSFLKQFIAGRDGDLRGHLREVAELDRIDAASVVAAREGAIWSLERSGDELKLDYLERSIAFPVQVEQALACLLSGAPVRVSDIAGELDGEEMLVLVRRLIREGLIRRVAP